jgi:hypothetical protein
MPTIATQSRADRRTYRFVDQRAASEAAAALHAAAAGAPDNSLLQAANAVFGDDPYDRSRDRMHDAVGSKQTAPMLRAWMRELREVASAWPDSGACTLATALKLWSWTVDHFRAGEDHIVDELAGVLAPMIAARCAVIDAVTSKSELKIDLSHVYAAHVSALAATACAELVYGYRRHLVWDVEGCAKCYVADDLDDLEAVMPGIASGARTSIDVIESDGSHPAKRGPCASFEGLETFVRFRSRLDACLTGARVAKDRAATALAGGR